MLNFLEVSLVNENIFYIELSKVYGIGLNISKRLCGAVGISLIARVFEVSKKQLESVLLRIKLQYKVDGQLRSFNMVYLQQQFDIKCYKSLRKINGLPCNGQRTKTNAKTARKLNRNHFIK